MWGERKPATPEYTAARSGFPVLPQPGYDSGRLVGLLHENCTTLNAHSLPTTSRAQPILRTLAVRPAPGDTGKPAVRVEFLRFSTGRTRGIERSVGAQLRSYTADVARQAVGLVVLRVVHPSLYQQLQGTALESCAC